MNMTKKELIEKIAEINSILESILDDHKVLVKQLNKAINQLSEIPDEESKITDKDGDDEE